MHIFIGCDLVINSVFEKNNDVMTSIFLVPVNLLKPLVYTCSMEFMMARQYAHGISFLILHKAYVTSVI